MIELHFLHLIILAASCFVLGMISREKGVINYKHRVRKFMIDTNYQLMMMHITCVAHGGQVIADASKQRLKPLIDKTDDWRAW